jgi:hypothetical protein
MFCIRHSSCFGLILMITLAARIAAAAHGGGVTVTVIPGEHPRKDQICVTSVAKVGDAFKNTRGDLLTITAISGFSLMCTKHSLRTLASAEFSPASSFQSAMTIDLPEGFVALELTEKEKFDGIRMRLADKKASLYMRVKSSENHPPFDLKAFVDQQRELQTSVVKVAQSDIESLAINGVSAMRWETETKPWQPLGQHLTVITTVLAGDSETVVVHVWGSPKNVAQAREKLLAIGESVAWHDKEAMPLPDDAAPSAAPASSATAAPTP